MTIQGKKISELDNTSVLALWNKLGSSLSTVYFPLWDGSKLSNSSIYTINGNVGVGYGAGSITSTYKLSVDGTIYANTARFITHAGSGNRPIGVSSDGSITTTIDGYNNSNWDTSYNRSPVGLSVSGTDTKTITITKQDGSTLTASFEDTGGTGSQVQSDWAQTDIESVDYIRNKPTLFSGSYTDLTDKPTIPNAQIQSDWAQANISSVDYIKNKPTFATVATSGSYTDLINKLTSLSQLTNDLGFITDAVSDGFIYGRKNAAWEKISAGGDVFKVGTPTNNQIGVWTGDGTIEGSSALTFDGNILNITSSSNELRLTSGTDYAKLYWQPSMLGFWLRYSGNNYLPLSLEPTGLYVTGSVSLNNTSNYSTSDGSIRFDGSDLLGKVGGSWVSLTAGGTGYTPQVTTKGDLFTYSTAPARLGVGTDNQVLTVDSSTATGLKWATPASGFLDPMTTRGDIIYRNSSNVTSRLGLGLNGQVLSSNGSDLVWATPAGGGNVSNSGTPVSGQLATWNSSTTIYGANVLTADGFGLNIKSSAGNDPQIKFIDGDVSSRNLTQYFQTNAHIFRYYDGSSSWYPLTLKYTGLTTPAIVLTDINSGSYEDINGSIVYNGTDFLGKVGGTWKSLTAGAGGGSGTVTNFSAGNLSPLFTTSVANSTTTPALSFSLSSASSYTVFGNQTGSSAAPSYGKLSISTINATGTPSASTYLRGDGSWATVSGGSSYWQSSTGYIAPLTISDEVRIGSITDLGSAKLQVTGDVAINTDAETIVLSTKKATGTGKNLLLTTSYAITTGSANACFGSLSLESTTTGSNNVAIGAYSMLENTTGSENTAIGSGSMETNIGGYSNSAIGFFSLRLNTSGYENTSIGEASLYNNHTGQRNSVVGSKSLLHNTTGSNNIALGYCAGNEYDGGSVLFPSGCIYIGNETQSGQGSSPSNEIVIGNGSMGLGSNSTLIGNFSTTKTFLYGNVESAGSVKVSNDSSTATAANVGAIRYRTSGNNSYCEMAMQTGVSTYSWVVIKQNNW